MTDLQEKKGTPPWSRADLLRLALTDWRIDQLSSDRKKTIGKVNR